MLNKLIKRLTKWSYTVLAKQEYIEQVQNATEEITEQDTFLRDIRMYESKRMLRHLVVKHWIYVFDAKVKVPQFIMQSNND